MPTIPIFIIRLLDLTLNDDPKTKKQHLNAAKDLARKYQHLFDKKDLDIQIFHNDKVEYSGVQLGSFQGSPEWTAIGKKPVKALKLWYKCFKKESNALLGNTIKIKENYHPIFLDYHKKYKSSSLLISDDLAKQLNDITDKFAIYDRLEKYLYGNFQVFFQHIGFEHVKAKNFLKITVEEAHQLPKALPVYHGNKKTAFRVIFTCNFLLPQAFRLGQSTALGYGRTFHLQ